MNAPVLKTGVAFAVTVGSNPTPTAYAQPPPSGWGLCIGGEWDEKTHRCVAATRGFDAAGAARSAERIPPPPHGVACSHSCGVMRTHMRRTPHPPGFDAAGAARSAERIPPPPFGWGLCIGGEWDEKTHRCVAATRGFDAEPREAPRGPPALRSSVEARKAEGSIPPPEVFPRVHNSKTHRCVPAQSKRRVYSWP